MGETPLDRRPNPPGWVPPRVGSNYNPYDPKDQRPPQGYPSEFKTPGKKSTWSQIPQDATQYQQMKETMHRLQYTPRPKSQLYPGQYKVLRRVDNYSKFYRGGTITTRLLTFGVITYAVFFHRWNDGYDTIFSDFYRFRLRTKLFFKGELTREEYDDLHSKQRGFINQPTGSMLPIETEMELKRGGANKELDPKYAMESPNPRHLKEAERILQEREEKLMKAIDIAEEQIALGNVEKMEKSRKKLFGIW